MALDGSRVVGCSSRALVSLLISSLLRCFSAVPIRFMRMRSSATDVPNHLKGAIISAELVKFTLERTSLPYRVKSRIRADSTWTYSPVPFSIHYGMQCTPPIAAYSGMRICALFLSSSDIYCTAFADCELRNS